MCGSLIICYYLQCQFYSDLQLCLYSQDLLVLGAHPVHQVHLVQPVLLPAIQIKWKTRPGDVFSKPTCWWVRNHYATLKTSPEERKWKCRLIGATMWFSSWCRKEIRKIPKRLLWWVLTTKHSPLSTLEQHGLFYQFYENMILNHIFTSVTRVTTAIDGAIDCNVSYKLVSHGHSYQHFIKFSTIKSNYCINVCLCLFS